MDFSSHSLLPFGCIRTALPVCGFSGLGGCGTATVFSKCTVRLLSICSRTVPGQAGPLPGLHFRCPPAPTQLEFPLRQLCLVPQPTSLTRLRAMSLSSPPTASADLGPAGPSLPNAPPTWTIPAVLPSRPVHLDGPSSFLSDPLPPYLSIRRHPGFSSAHRPI